MASKQEIRQLKDYEVLGVGALRRHALLARSYEVELFTHPALIAAGQSEVYEALLRETLAWLKPQQVHAAPLAQSRDEFLLEALLEVLRHEYPQTVAYLKGGLRELLKDYFKEVPWQGPLLSAHLRYWPVFLKRKFQDNHLYLIAQREWLASYLSFADFGLPTKETGRLVVNPSLQSLYTDVPVEEVHLDPGLTAFFYDYAGNKLCEYKMDLWDAAIVDSLQEDRKFTQEQLLNQLLMMELETPLPQEDWHKRLSQLQSLGIVMTL